MKKFKNLGWRFNGFPSSEILTLKGFELAARNGTGRGQVARRTADKSRRTTSDRHADQILSAIYYQYEADGRYVDKGPLSGHGLLLGKANRAWRGPDHCYYPDLFPFLSSWPDTLAKLILTCLSSTFTYVVMILVTVRIGPHRSLPEIWLSLWLRK